MPRSPRLASYRLHATLDTANHRVTATGTIHWTNGGQSPVDALPFHLYLNAFKNEASVFMQESRGQLRGAHASATHWGWIDVTSMKIAGAERIGLARFPGPDQTVLEVPLAQPIAPGASVDIEVAFTSQLPEVFARTGWVDDFHMVGQWFPKPGVRVGAPGAETWACEPFHANAEFFADFGVYDVDVTVPDSVTVAATGVLVGAKDNGNHTRTLTYHAEDVHDFAWMTDPYMEVLSGKAQVEGGPVAVRVYYRPAQEDFARRHLAAGIGAIETFSALYGAYPWSTMSIIDPPPEAESGAGGMEYPTLVTTGGDSAVMRPGVRLPEFVTIHEVGHNWFQGMLASNEAEEAWLDEGVNQYADAVVMAKLYGPRASLIDWMGFTGETGRVFAALTPTRQVPSAIAQASWTFADNAAYGAATYAKTATALRTLEGVVGSEAFAAALKRYAETWAFRHPTGKDFFATLATALDQDLGWFIGPAFHGIGGVELSVRSASCRPRHEPRGVFGDGNARKVVTSDQAPDGDTWVCDVLIANTGTIAVPVDIELRFADGTRAIDRWEHKDDGHWHAIRIERSSPLVEVEIDPGDRVLLDDDPVDNQLRLIDDAGAAARASARATYWTETTMQVMGL